MHYYTRALYGILHTCTKISISWLYVCVSCLASFFIAGGGSLVRPIHGGAMMLSCFGSPLHSSTETILDLLVDFYHHPLLLVTDDTDHIRSGGKYYLDVCTLQYLR